MARKVTFQGKEIEELKQLSVKEFAELLPSNLRRSLRRGFSHSQQKLLDKIKKENKKLRTHARDLIILPEMVGHRIGVHNGKTFVDIEITIEMLGLRLGDFALTTQKVQHNAPGIGATKGTAGASAK